MNEDVIGNRKLFQKEVSNTKVGKVEERVAADYRMGMGGWHRERMKCERLCKEYFEDRYNIDTEEQVAVHMCSFDGIRRGN